jgi:oligopeptide transport system substrate-binding protein
LEWNIQMLAEWSIAGKRRQMRRSLALLLFPAMVLMPAACRQQPKGAIKVVVIGGEPKLRDPALGPLAPGDAVLLENVAQGLVRFDASGNIVGGLAERWNVSEDGLSYIFRLASTQWPDGRKVTAEQVAKILKRQLAGRSRNSLKGSAGGIQDVVAMTDRVLQIELVAPRPNLLAILAQPEFAILRGNSGTGPFKVVANGGPAGELRLTREIASSDDAETRHEEVLLAGASTQNAIAVFAASRSDLVLDGTFADLPLTRAVRLPAGALRFDPASGLFGLVPVHSGGQFDSPDARHLLAQALDRGNFVSGLGVPGLAARPTLLEPGLDGVPSVTGPDWFARPLVERLAALRAQAAQLFGTTKPVVRVTLPPGPGANFLMLELKRDWGALGLEVTPARDPGTADFTLIDEVAPSSSPAWFVRRFRCGVVPICDTQADQLMDAARQMPVPAQRYALLVQAAGRIDDAQLFIPITAPIRWSLVSNRVQNFAGNRYARHTLTDLEQQSTSD